MSRRSVRLLSGMVVLMGALMTPSYVLADQGLCPNVCYYATKCPAESEWTSICSGPQHNLCAPVDCLTNTGNDCGAGQVEITCIFG